MSKTLNLWDSIWVGKCHQRVWNQDERKGTWLFMSSTKVNICSGPTACRGYKHSTSAFQWERMRVNKITEHLHPHAEESHSSSHVTEISVGWEYLTSLPAWHPYLQQIVCIFTGRGGDGSVEKTLSGLCPHQTNSSEFYRQGGLWHWHNTSLRTLLKTFQSFKLNLFPGSNLQFQLTPRVRLQGTGEMPEFKPPEPR